MHATSPNSARGPVFPWLVALFVGLPMVELYLLIQVGARIGPLATLAVVVITGILGASLARRQGFRAWNRIQSELAAGRMPGAELVDGLLILIGGIVLLTPGLLTDAAGFALMVPGVRQIIRVALTKRFEAQIRGASMPGGRIQPDDDVIDV